MNIKTIHNFNDKIYVINRYFENILNFVNLTENNIYIFIGGVSNLDLLNKFQQITNSNIYYCLDSEDLMRLKRDRFDLTLCELLTFYESSFLGIKVKFRNLTSCLVASGVPDIKKHGDDAIDINICKEEFACKNIQNYNGKLGYLINKYPTVSNSTYKKYSFSMPENSIACMNSTELEYCELIA